MATSDPRDRLQPALLDRLTDDTPELRSEPDERRTMTKAQLRRAVLRDLHWLLNAVQPLPARAAREYPALAGSVLNLGLPPLAGQLASKIDVATVERAIREAVQRFEPRILASSVQVRALEATSVLDTHNVVEFEIRGQLWAQPMPLEILLRTQLDLEAGSVRVQDMGA